MFKIFKAISLILALTIFLSLFAGCGMADTYEDNVVPEFEGEVYHGDFNFRGDIYSETIETGVNI